MFIVNSHNIFRPYIWRDLIYQEMTERSFDLDVKHKHKKAAEL